MSASGSYLHTEAPDFPGSDLDPFMNPMNPMLRQPSAPTMIGLNNPAFMQAPSAGPPHHMGLNPNPGGPNPPMGMLSGGPDMRFAPGHNTLIPRGMAMRPGGRPPMNPGAMPGMPMGGLTHNPQMQGGMGFPGGMMPGPGMAVRRVASNPTLNPNLGVNGQSMMIQQQIQQQQQQQQQMRMQQQQQQARQQQMELAMMNRQPGNPQNSAVVRTGSAGQLMHSLSQPASLNQPSHPGGMPQNNFQSPIVPPPQSSSPRARTPVMSMPSGPSQPPLNRGHMSDEMFINFQQNQYPPRMVGNGQFPFGTSPTPPLNMSEPFPPNAGTPGRPSNFPPTPAQQLSMQQQHGAATENGYGFNMAPQRPLSNNQHPSLQQQHSPPQQPPQHHSPHHSDHMNTHPPRPQSQPQPQQPPNRPLSSAGPSHTPRPAQPGLPTNPGLLPAGRLPPSQPPQPPNPNLRPQSSGSSSHQQPIAPRPPAPPQASAPASSDGTLMSTTASSASPPDANAMLAGSIPRPPASSAQTYSIGYGQGLIRVMQFSGLLGSDAPHVQSQKLHLSYWDNLIREYFTPKAIMKLTLWRDSLKNEAKPFEIGVPILPRFFLVTTQSGVKSMSLTLDGARERLYAPGHAIVECVTAIWTCRYSNGHIVTLRGPLTAHLVICSPAPPPHPGAATTNGAPPYVLKFDDFEFDAHSHDKYIALDAIAGPRKTEDPPPTMNGAGDEDKKWEEPRLIIENGSIPGEPVNAFGIPQATMRCLELAESVGQMADLISFARDQEVGPLAALKSFADKIREEQPQLAIMNGFVPNPFYPGPSAQGNTLYSSAPPSVTNPGSAQPSSSMSSPQNAPPSAHNSPQKQHKTIPTKGSVASASTPTTSTTNNTPAMASAPLKRKAAPTDTPTTAPEPLPKRSIRRRRTGGG
ncbi:LIM-domain binding protein-domain-containing protein [Mycena capillaripes]|nr:LIM-domain binding protein-domain-containing protein [Mycena capillaripes]